MAGTKQPSEMTDEEWMAAVAEQEAAVRELETHEAHARSVLKAAKSAAKVGRDTLGAIIRRENLPQPDPDEPGLFPNEPLPLPDGMVDVPPAPMPTRGRRGPRSTKAPETP